MKKDLKLLISTTMSEFNIFPCLKQGQQGRKPVNIIKSVWLHCAFPRKTSPSFMIHETLEFVTVEMMKVRGS